MDLSKYGKFVIENVGCFEIATDFELVQWDKPRLSKRCLDKGVSLVVFNVAYTKMNSLKRRIRKTADETIDAFQYEGKLIKPVALKSTETPESMRKKNEEKLKKLTVRFYGFIFIYNN